MGGSRWVSKLPTISTKCIRRHRTALSLFHGTPACCSYARYLALRGAHVAPIDEGPVGGLEISDLHAALHDLHAAVLRRDAVRGDLYVHTGPAAQHLRPRTAGVAIKVWQHLMSQLCLRITIRMG